MGWRQFVLIGLIGSAALPLAACGYADSRASVPSFMRLPEAEAPAPEAAPNVRQLVHDKMDSVFVSTSNAHDVRVSRPLHDPRGPGWTACVKADVNSSNGQPIGTQTYRIFISESEIVDRRRVDAGDNCLTENYEPI
jgi:hypothetical protein